MPTDVIRHKRLIQDYFWPKSRYDCILGVWSLCYLHGEDLETVLLRMQTSVKSSGFIVFMEPVLKEASSVDEQEIAEKEAQMKARKTRWYEQLFQQLDLQLLETRFHQRSNRLLTDVRVYVLKTGLQK